MTTFNELYSLFIHRLNLFETRILKSSQKFDINTADITKKLRKIWQSKARKHFEKKSLYRFAFLRIRDEETLSNYQGKSFYCRFCWTELETHEHLIFKCPSLTIFRKETFPKILKQILYSFESEQTKVAIVVVMASWKAKPENGSQIAHEMLL